MGDGDAQLTEEGGDAATESPMEEDADAESQEEDADAEPSESEDTDEEMAAERWKYPAVELGNGGVILVLCETLSGFAIFSYDGVKLRLPNACQNIWADFTDHIVAKRAVWLVDFQAFEDKLSATNLSSGVTGGLAAMIEKHIVSGQKLAVETEHYKRAIKNNLNIDCLYDPAVEELMWGLKVQMAYLVPEEKQTPAEEDQFPMSEGMKFILNFHGFRFKPNMMVTRRIIQLAGVVHGCDLCVNKHRNNLHNVAEYLKDISHIDTQDWDLMKIATALKMICCPERKVVAPRSLFSKQEWASLRNDRPKYKGKILKMPLLVVYDEISWARESRYKAARLLSRLLDHALKASEGAADHETCLDGEKERSERIGFEEEAACVVTEITACSHALNEERKGRQILPSLVPVSFEGYSHISSYPLHRTNEPGILSIDISSLEIVATGGIDTNAVLCHWPSGEILCTLTDHSKKITSLKFATPDELLITGSADKTVRLWQGGESGSYSCIHTIYHTAEVEAVTVPATQKYFATASKDNSWHFYDILTGCCLTEVHEASEQEGYTSASFHPDGLLLGTGTTAVAKIWDVRTQSNVAELKGHVGPVTAMSFSENGHHLATAGQDGVKIWDIRKCRYFRNISPYYSDITTNAVEFDFSGSYLAMGGSDIRICHVDKVEYTFVKKLSDPYRKGKVTSVKFGAQATFIAVGSMDHNLRIFGDPDLTWWR